MASYKNIRPAGMSDDEDLSDYEDFGLSSILRFGLKKRKKSKAVVKQQTSTSSVLSMPTKKPPVSFWEKKQLAFETFGEASIRPQDQYRSFLLHRRQLNNGSMNQMWVQNTKSEDISKSQYPVDVLQDLVETVPPPLYENEIEIVNDSASFHSMMDVLWEQQEITIDLEGNTEHSYLGMTVIIQIGTFNKDYIIDVFPVVKLIKTDLKEYLEGADGIIYVFGGDNDILWLKRDFFIYIVQVLDIQTLFQIVLKDGLLDKVMEGLPFLQRKSWYLKYIGPRNNQSSATELRNFETNASNQGMSFEKIVELFYPETDINKDAQVADFRPRDLNDPQCQQLIKYARDDVHILLRVVAIIKKNLSIAGSAAFEKCFDLTKKKTNVIFHRQNMLDCKSYLKSKAAVKPRNDQMEQFCMIYDWRNHHASIIDESPSSMFTEAQLLSLIQSPPTKPEELADRTSVPKGRKREMHPPESIQTWKMTLFNLLTKGQDYHTKIMSIQCHNCRQVVGHAGWGCPLPWSIESTKRNVKENPESRNKQNRRRRLNKKKNKRAAEAENKLN